MEFKTPLCKLCYDYGSDKCPQLRHPYTPFYYEYLKDKNIKTILEIGIGNLGYLEGLKKKYRGEHVMGGSLRMWRDFYGARVYGIDNQEECMFEAEGIKTFLASATDPIRLKEIIEEIGDVDLVIDDASHFSNEQVETARILLPLLKKDVIYVIEDVKFAYYVLRKLRNYRCWIPELPGNRCREQLVLIKNK